MIGLINAVFLVLLTSLPASAKRVKHLEKVGLETEIVEDGKKDTTEGAEKISLDKDKLDLQAGGVKHAAGTQGAPAKTGVPWRGGCFIKGVDAHNATQASGDSLAEFFSALKNVFRAIYTEIKTATKAEFCKSVDPGSDLARNSKKEAIAAAVALINAETSLRERTELLAGEAFGDEMIIKYMLEGYDHGEDKTLKRVLERLHVQVEQLAIEKFGFKRKDIVGLEKLVTQLSALEGQVEAMQGLELDSDDSDEIDLTNPLLLGANAMYSEIVKFMPEFLKVQLSFLRKIVEKRTMKQGKVVQGIELHTKMKMEIILSSFLKEVEKMEQRMEMEGIIRKAIEDFAKAKVSTPADYKLAKEELGQAVKETMETLVTFDPKMNEHQKARINEAVKEKKEAMENVSN